MILIEQLIEILKDNIGNKLHSIYVYGSVGRGEAILGKSDIDLCHKRYVYDDNSKDKIVKEILEDKSLKLPNKEFDVVIGDKNLGCKYSFIEALKYIKNENKDNKDYLVITIDNDVIVQKDWINKTLDMYGKIKIFSLAVYLWVCIKCRTNAQLQSLNFGGKRKNPKITATQFKLVKKAKN